MSSARCSLRPIVRFPAQFDRPMTSQHLPCSLTGQDNSPPGCLPRKNRMPLKLLTLNIEGDRHIDRVRATLKSHLPDIACLQEVLEEDCSRLAAIGDYQV